MKTILQIATYIAVAGVGFLVLSLIGVLLGYNYSCVIATKGWQDVYIIVIHWMVTLPVMFESEYLFD